MALPKWKEFFLSRSCKCSNEWYWNLSERNDIFQEALTAVQCWHFKTSQVLQFSEWGNHTECSNFPSWSLVTAIMQKKKTQLHRLGAHWPSYLEIPDQTQTALQKFCTSWYQFLTTNTNVKGPWEMYLLPRALSSRMLALVSMCRKHELKLPSCPPSTFGSNDC